MDKGTEGEECGESDIGWEGRPVAVDAHFNGTKLLNTLLATSTREIFGAGRWSSPRMCNWR